MAKVSRDNENGLLSFRCPGCKEVHTVRFVGTGAWGWNFDEDRPTLTPSVLARSGHYVPGSDQEQCWCTFNAEHPEEEPAFICSICHSFVTDGKIQFLNDCTHVLAGQTVDLPEF